jgi:hypothetical protein
MRLEITGYKDQIPNSLFGEKDSSEHLGIIFPGVGYSSQMPALYYPTRVLLTLGADVLRLDHHYQRPDFQALPDEEKTRWLEADALAVLKAALAIKAYKRLTFVGKSIGTVALARILFELTTLDNADFIWLTPLLKRNGFKEAIARHPHKALFIIGSDDQQYDPVLLEQIRASTTGQVLLIEGADHSLEIKDDVAASVRIQERIAIAIERFITPIPSPP